MNHVASLLQSPSTYGGTLGIPAPPQGQDSVADKSAPGVTTFEQLPGDLLYMIMQKVTQDDIRGQSNLACFTHANSALHQQVRPLANTAGVLNALRTATDAASLCSAIDAIGTLDKSLQSGCWDVALRMRDNAPWLDEAGRQLVTGHMHEVLPHAAPGTKWLQSHWEQHRTSVQLRLLDPPHGTHRNDLLRAQAGLEILTLVHRDASVSPRLLAASIDHLDHGFQTRSAELRQQLTDLQAQASPPVAAVLGILLACTTPTDSVGAFGQQLQLPAQIADDALRRSVLGAAARNWSACMRTQNHENARSTFAKALGDMPARDQLALFRKACAPQLDENPGVAAALPFILRHIEEFPAEELLRSIGLLSFSDRKSVNQRQSLCVLMDAVLGSERLRRRSPGEQARVLNLVLDHLSKIAIPEALLARIEALKATLPVSLQQGVELTQRLQALSRLTDNAYHAAVHNFMDRAGAMLDDGAASTDPTGCLQAVAGHLARWMQPLMPRFMARLEHVPPPARASILKTLAERLPLLMQPGREQTIDRMIDACSRLPVTLAASALEHIARSLASYGNDHSRETLRRACDALPVHLRPPIPPRRAAS